MQDDSGPVQNLIIFSGGPVQNQIQNSALFRYVYNQAVKFPWSVSNLTLDLFGGRVSYLLIIT